MRIITLFSFFLFTAGNLFAQIPQDFFIPTEFQRAYRKGTRSLDGKPGPNFWQNRADYTLEVEVDPLKKYITGQASITYTNNSPDELDFIYFTLLSDIARTGNVRDEALPASWVGDGTLIRSLKINNTPIDVDSRQSVFREGTNMRVRLPEPLVSGQSLTVELDWEEALPDGDAGRHGFVDSTTCFAGYWYPKVSVYDDIDGWDTNSFLGQAEFYSELSNFDVSISIPQTYTVWATGMLQNAEEVLPAEMLDRYERVNANEVVTLIGEDDLKAGVRMKSGTWRFKAEEVPDFAFAFSDHYIWESILLPTERHEVRISSVYPASRKQYCKKTAQWQADIMKFFSEEMPGVPFPYPAFTSFYKPYPSGGMEFPMMANNGSPEQPQWMVALTAHEMYHMYKPFYLRTNEEKYAWMDEGWADFMDIRARDAVLGTQTPDAQRINQKFYLERTLGSQTNVPMITSTAYQNGDNYGYTSYTHPAFIYGLLEEALGEDKFKECLQGYMKRWAHKSPTPYDFFMAFNDLSGEDLSWFWKPWFMEWGYPDLGIQEVEPGKVTVVRKGNKPISVHLELIFEDGKSIEKELGISVWKNGSRELEFSFPDDKKLTRVHLNAWLPDIDPSDNFYLAEEETQGMDMQAYEGTYGLGGNTNSVAYVTAGDQHIIFESTGTGNRYLMLPVGEDKFESPDGTFEMKFQRDGEGKVSGYKSNRLGNSFTDVRME